MRAIGAAVIRQDPLYGDASLGEPIDCAVQDADGGGCGFVVVDLCVRDPGVVGDDGVHERVPKLRAVVLIAWFAWGGGAVPLAFDAGRRSAALIALEGFG